MQVFGFGSKMLFTRRTNGWLTDGLDTEKYLVPFVSEGITKTFQKIRAAVLEGKAGLRESYNGPITVEGEIPIEMSYENLGFILQLALGSSASPYTIEDQLAEAFQIIIDKQLATGGRWQIDRAKIAGFTIAGSAKDTNPLRMTLKCIMQDITLSDTSFPASGTNFDGNGLTSFTPIMFHDMTFKIQGTNWGIESFELSFDRKLKGDDYASKCTENDSNAQYNLEPIEDGFREVSLKIAIPRYLANTLVDYKNNDTSLTIDMDFANGAKALNIDFAIAKVKEGFDNQIAGPGIVRQEGTFDIFRSLSANELTFTLTP